jgi:hypothetical protein
VVVDVVVVEVEVVDEVEVVVEELVVDAIFSWTVVVVCSSPIVVDGERVDVVDSGIMVIGAAADCCCVVVVTD